MDGAVFFFCPLTLLSAVLGLSFFTLFPRNYCAPLYPPFEVNPPLPPLSRFSFLIPLFSDPAPAFSRTPRLPPPLDPSLVLSF